MKNKDYVITELETAIKNVQTDTGMDEGKLKSYFETVFELIEKSF